MRVAVACLLAVTATASARPHKHAPKKHHATLVRGQSVGAPWQGELRDPARLPDGEGYHLRRPGRSFGTRAAVEVIAQVVAGMRTQFPDVHELAIGDLSAEHGGPVSEHHSHQSGRDADIGLIYKAKPDDYPASFVAATEANLDCAATYALVAEFAGTTHDDGGVQVIFLDFKVQGLLYRWAKDAGIDDDVLGRTLQYPRRGISAGLVRHEPNHSNHMHVRFKCPKGDSACR
jgi:murein endopeptidase